MKFSLLALLPAVLAAPLAPIVGKLQDNLIPGKFIVQLASGSDDKTLQTTVARVTSLIGGEPTQVYSFGDFKGFAITATDSLLESVRQIASIQLIERDAIVKSSYVQQNAAYGLDRISHRQNGAITYNYDSSSGQGTYAYIIDTGIRITHQDFGGRATWGANFAKDGIDTDGNGHGTHVAGTTGGATYGVAKKTNLIAVKVLDSSGSGSLSNVIAGIQWAVNDAKSKGRIGKAVANLSLGGGLSQVTNNAATEATNQGLFLAVAAGNSNVDASNSSPASAAAVCTVGATDANDNRASFSNYGAALDLFAPGVAVVSAWKDSDSATATLSGTSMAAPHVAGIGAYLLTLEGARSPGALCDRIKALATKNVVKNPGASSPNQLAFNGY